MTLLVVEDEYLILEFVCSEMSEAGLPAVGATTADEALRILHSMSDISALVTDINMPGSMNGLQLAGVVHMRWPRQKKARETGAFYGWLIADYIFIPSDFIMPIF